MLCNKNHKNAQKKYEFISYLENNYVMELVRHHSWTYFQRLEFGFNENSKWRWGPCSKICPSWFTVKQKLVMDILDIWWWVLIVTFNHNEEEDVQAEFMHPLGPSRSFKYPFAHGIARFSLTIFWVKLVSP